MPDEDDIEDVQPARKKRPDEEAFGATPKQPRRDHEPRPGRSDDDFDDEPRPRRRYEDEEQGDMTGGVIPYKNPAALIAYYLGVFSLIPGLGCVLAPIAIFLGIVGFIKAGQHPKARGKAHAIVAILLGAVGAPLLWIGIYFLFRFAAK